MITFKPDKSGNKATVCFKKLILNIESVSQVLSVLSFYAIIMQSSSHSDV